MADLSLQCGTAEYCAAMIAIGRLFKLSEILDAVASKQERAFHYHLYWADPERPPILNDEFLVGEPVQISDDDVEIYPESATSRKFWVFCSDELIQDVVDLAIHQKSTASHAELLACLEHYIEHDDFMDLG